MPEVKDDPVMEDEHKLTAMGDGVQGFLEGYEYLKRRGQLEPILRDSEAARQRPPEIEEMYALKNAFKALRVYSKLLQAHDDTQTDSKQEDAIIGGSHLHQFCVHMSSKANIIGTESLPGRVPKEIREITEQILDMAGGPVAFKTVKTLRLQGKAWARNYFESAGWLERRARDRSRAANHAMRRLAPIFDPLGAAPITSQVEAKAAEVMAIQTRSRDAQIIRQELEQGKSVYRMLIFGEIVWGFCDRYIQWRKPRKNLEIPVRPELLEILAMRAILLELRHIEIFSQEIQIQAAVENASNHDKQRVEWALHAGVIIRQYMKSLLRDQKNDFGFKIDKSRGVRLPGGIPTTVRKAAELLHLLLPRAGYNIGRISAEEAKEGKLHGLKLADLYFAERNLEMRDLDRIEAEERLGDPLYSYAWPPLAFWKQQH